MTQSHAPRTENPARFYEDLLVPTLFRPFAMELVERAAPRPGERVLDVACGTGIVARLAAERLRGDAHIVGFDVNPAMLEVAKEEAAHAGARIEWQAGNAEVLPFPNASFDLVTCQQGLQAIPDTAAALREMHRVLGAGGRLATSTWTAIENHPFDQLVAEAIERHFGSPAFHAPFALGDRDLLASLFRQAGFEQFEIEEVRLDIHFPSPAEYVELIVVGGAAALPAFQRLGMAARDRLIDAVRADIARAVQQHTLGDKLVLPNETAIVVARMAA